MSKWLLPSPAENSEHQAVADAEARSRPLTSSEQLQTQLRQAQLQYQMAAEMSQFKASFLARTSHELRSPINSVISLHQLIVSDLCDSPAEEREFVSQAQAAALKMLGRLDELIEISKIEHGTSPPQLRSLQLAEVLEEIRRLTYLQAQNRSLRLEVKLPDPSVYVLADPRWLRQVLINLVTTPTALMREGSIRLSTQLAAEAKQVQILIEDQRPVEGWREPEPIAFESSLEQVNSEQLKQLARSPNFLPSDPPGLDLTINQMLMQLMGGQLEILSTPLENGEAALSEALLPFQIATELPKATQTLPLTQIRCSLPLVLPQDESHP